MSVAGYEKVKTKVIEGKKKCIYKKHNGTKLYVKGFGKMRSVESYVKLCKKAAAKSVKSTKPVKSKKTRSKTARKYGGFLQEFFTNIENMETGKEKKSDKSSAVVNQHSTTATTATAPPAMSPATPPPAGEGFSDMSVKTGGSNCNRGGKNRNRQGGNNSNSRQGGNGMINDFSKMLSMGGYRGGQSQDQFQNQAHDQFQNQAHDQFQNQAHDQFQNQSQSQDGGRRRKRNKVPKSMLDKLMMAANFGKRSAKKGKKLRRKGGNSVIASATNAFGQSINSLGFAGGKKGGSSQFNY
jgi:hypothetical protein